MSATLEPTGTPAPVRTGGRARRRARSWLPALLMLSPSMLLIGVFVYGMMGWNIRVAMTDQHTHGGPGNFVGLTNFIELWSEERWLISVRHVVLFTIVFVGGALLLGWFLALLMDKGIRGETGFRVVYLFPMAISFIATGIVWRWLMDPSPPERAVGLNQLFQGIGLDFLANTWWQHQGAGMAAMAIPAIWQMSGYMMALFLAGFRGIPEDMREAARTDGASEWQIYRHVVLPQLRPVTLSAVIILGHMSLKVFDLIIAISGQQLITDVPAIFMWQTVFSANDPAKGATIGSYILIAVAVFIIPYLVWSMRAEKRS